MQNTVLIMNKLYGLQHSVGKEKLFNTVGYEMSCRELKVWCGAGHRKSRKKRIFHCQSYCQGDQFLRISFVYLYHTDEIFITSGLYFVH